jgi:hypothetical protein
MGNLDLYHNLLKCCSSYWVPMDDALVNASSHNPTSNVFYMVHKALPKGRALPKSGDCMRWSQVQPCH